MVPRVTHGAFLGVLGNAFGIPWDTLGQPRLPKRTQKRQQITYFSKCGPHLLPDRAKGLVLSVLGRPWARFACSCLLLVCSWPAFVDLACFSLAFVLLLLGHCSFLFARARSCLLLLALACSCLLLLALALSCLRLLALACSLLALAFSGLLLLALACSCLLLLALAC